MERLIPTVVHWYVGYDDVEPVAYHTLSESIIQNSSRPVAICPVKESLFKHFYGRPRDPKQSNEFSFTRFLVPYLQNYSGWAVFSDCDMLMLGDLDELWQQIDATKAVMVVKHDYEPTSQTKYLDNVQYPYPRKNWSSVILWNCGHFANRRLTPEYIEKSEGLHLHRFQWLNDDQIGEISVNWNHLVGEYAPNEDAKLVHYTIGGPWFYEYANCEFHEEWENYRNKMAGCAQRVKTKVSGK